MRQFYCLLPGRCIPALWEIAMQDHRTSDLGGILESTDSIAHLYHITGDAPDFPSPEEPGRLQSMGWQRVRQDLALSTVIFRNSGRPHKTSVAPSLWPLVSYLSFPLGSLLHRGTCPWVCSACQCLDSTNGKIKIEDGPTLPVEHQVQREYTGMEMAFCQSSPLYQLPTGNVAISL